MGAIIMLGLLVSDSTMPGGEEDEGCLSEWGLAPIRWWFQQKGAEGGNQGKAQGFESSTSSSGCRSKQWGHRLNVIIKILILHV